MTKWLVIAGLLCAWLLSAAARADEASAEPARQLYMRAAAALEAKDVPAAAAELAKLIEQYPEDELAPRAALGLAECHLAQGDSAAAIRVLDAWMPKLASSAHTHALDPTAKLRAQLVRVHAYFLADKPDEVMKIAREQADIYRGLGAISPAEKTILAQIEAIAQQAAKQSKQSQTQPLRSAGELARAGRYAEAQLLLDQCRPEQLEAAWLWRYRLLHAQCLINTDEPAAALEELDQIKLDSLTDPECTAVRMACLDAAMALQEHRRAQNEINALTILVRRDATLAPTVALRAVEVATLRKDRQTARRLALAAKESYPNFSATHEFDLLLARNAMASVEFEEARQILSALIASPPEHDPSAVLRAQWLLGESYFLSQDYRRAIAAYTAVIDSSSVPAWTEAALMQRGKCYELLGELAWAGADYRRIAQEFAQSSFAGLARDRLSGIDQYMRSANAAPATQLK